MNFSYTSQSFIKVFSFLFFVFFSQSALSEEIVFSGTFKGASGHETSGTVNIVKTEKGYVVVLNSDFLFDGAPDPRVGLGKNGEYDPDSELKDLKSNSGKQSYKIHSSIKLNKYNEVYIWCEQFSVPLGVAQIK